MIPATVITGFLGSGKTTLLKRILSEPHGFKIAIIENEFGAENIDHEILVQDDKEQILQMSNGCICCTIREDLRSGLASLAERRRKGEIAFDHLVIETTGLADPGPVAQTFFVDDEIAQTYRLDAVLTLVDAKHAAMQLDQHETAQRQVGFADEIFLSKTDLVSAEELADVRQRLRRINARARITEVPFGKVALRQVFDLQGFNLNDKLEIAPDFLDQHAGHGEHVHDEHCHHDHDHDHHHDHGHDHDHHHGHAHSHAHDIDHVKSFVFRSEKPFDMKRLEDFLGAVVQVYGAKMLRYKGLLHLSGNPRQVIFQGVHMLMASDAGPPWPKDKPRVSRMVFIGVDLPEDIFVQGLQQCLVD